MAAEPRDGAFGEEGEVRRGVIIYMGHLAHSGSSHTLVLFPSALTRQVTCDPAPPVPFPSWREAAPELHTPTLHSGSMSKVPHFTACSLRISKGSF